jgi:AraC-like DNA-binding protein
MDNNLLDLRGQAPKGVVDPAGAARRIRLGTYPPSTPLQGLVDYYWVVEWDMRGRAPETQRVLPYPNAHLVFEHGRTAIHGVVRGAFERRVEGRGKVFGIRFRPGGLRPWLCQSLSSIADRTTPADGVLGRRAYDAEQEVLGADSDAAMVALAEAMLLASVPATDPRVAFVQRAVAAAAAEHGPVSVAALCETLDIDERSLQRLFSNYVGVSPKWVIQRFRLQEATWHLGRCDQADLAALAVRLGFFDQAHFTRQFGELVGLTPLAYWQSQRTAALAPTPILEPRL